MTKKRILTVVAILITVLALGLFVFLLYSSGRYYRHEAVIPAIVLTILLVFTAGFLWEFSSKHSFPFIAFRERNAFSFLTRKWLRPIFFIPLIFALATNAAYWLPIRTHNVSDDLTLIFGAVSVVSLILSLVVLVLVHETFHGEIEQMTTAIELIQWVRKKLVLICLTPNLGYARAISEGEWKLCKKFHLALTEKLDELIKMAKKGDAEVQIRIGMLDSADRTKFFDWKKTILKKLPSEVDRKNLGDLYGDLTKELVDRIKELVAEAKNAPPLSDERFTYCEWQSNCLPQNSSDDPPANFPPLGILIADDHMAVLYLNSHLVTDQPIGLRGRILRSPEEIEMFTLLVDTYLKHYSQ